MFSSSCPISASMNVVSFNDCDRECGVDPDAQKKAKAAKKGGKKRKEETEVIWRRNDITYESRAELLYYSTHL